MDGVRNDTMEAIQRYLVSHGMSTQTGKPGHEIRNAKRRIIVINCAICGSKNSSIKLRCRGCDAFLVQPKPTGNDEQQKEYLAEYLENYNQIAKQQGFANNNVKAKKRKADPSPKYGRR